MAKAPTAGQTAVDTKGVGWMAISMAMVLITTKTVYQSIKASGLTAWDTEKVPKMSITVPSQASGSMALDMAKELSTT